MKIFVTDVGRYWNHETPILERYADCVVVVCLNGKKVTDKYECFISPYTPVGLGMDDYGILSARFKALKSVEQELRNTYSFHGDLVFLADNEPQSLYPYLVLKDNEKFNSMHLWCMSPYKMETTKSKKEYFEMLHDLSKLQSLLYVDSNILLEKLDKDAKLPDLNSKCEAMFAELLPQVLYEIDKKLCYDHRYYFDLGVKRYIETDVAFDKMLEAKPLEEKEIENHHPYLMHCTLGIAFPSCFPGEDEETKTEVCQVIPRIDGKEVCEKLKTMRKALADANGIPYEVVECPSTGPCAGTCMQCDKELRELQNALIKIPEGKRVYPKFDIPKGGQNDE